ncbi:MAG: hypothetical protein HY815_27685 [Candidatus Riflebacteria bacterium]|nr:hypothetical protein [Candidatus Riflebacteria bacterium]
MIVRRRFILGAVLLGLVSTLAPTRAVAADFNFKQDTELNRIFETIATLGKFNVVISPQVRAKMTLTLKGVDPLEAMYLVANIHNLKIKKVELKSAGPGAIDTYAIAQPEQIERGFEQGFTRTIRLRYAKAEEVAQVLGKALGKDSGVQFSVDTHKPTNAVIMRGTEEILSKVKTLIDDLDLPVAQVLLDAKVVTVNTNSSRDLGFTWNFGVGKVADGNPGKAPGQGGVVALTEYQRSMPNAQFYDSPSSPKGSDFFKFGDFFRQNFFFNASLNILENKGLVRTLAAPRLLAINGQKAELRIGDKVVFSGGPSQPPEERDTGLVMDVTPRVNKDNFISMEINVEQSAAKFDRPDYPTINRTATKTQVQVRDGEELLVGGLVTENLNDSEQKIPFLGDLPLVKHLFVHKIRQPSSQELVILITPHVVKQVLTATEPTGEVPGGAKGTNGIPEPDIDLDGGLTKGSPTPGPSPTGKGASPDINIDDL